MKTRNMITRRVLVGLLSVALVFTMMPLAGGGFASAESATAPGGTIHSNSKTEAENAFDGKATANKSGSTMTITLNSDVTLEQPLMFVMGNAGDKIILDLNGHTITGRAGTNLSTDWESVCGANAIDIVPSDFDVEIKGTGSIVGGKGATYVTGEGIRYGADGGTAVCFVAPENGDVWYPANEENALEHGLKITGGAQLIGGAGGDVSGDDWLNNIPQRSGSVGDNYQFSLSAGRGGAGIGQTNAGVEYRATTLAYARIEVVSGTVQGGSGGTIDLDTDNTPSMTHYGIMNNSTIDAYMQGLYSHTSTYDEYLANEILFLPGDGGDGIVIGTGRKYVSVDNGSSIMGGSCGTMDYGKSKWINNISNYDNQVPASGDGIGVYGDIGYKNIEADLTDENRASKGKSSADMGIYIAGTVKGGAPPTATAKYENAGEAGDGILLNGEDSYAKYVDSNKVEHTLTFPQGEDAEEWGIVEVADGGQVFGGNGAVAQNGSSSGGGIGIHEAYSKSNDGRAGESKIGTDYYLINGIVKGGNGGNSMKDIGPSGGNGFNFGNSRKDARIFGTGSATGGDGGSCIDRGDAFDPGSAAEGVRFYGDREYNNNASYISETDGNLSQLRQVDNSDLNIVANMSSFNDYPSTSTQLSCTVNKPDGYTGGAYITWFAEMKLQNNPSEVCVIEPPGTNNRSFNLLSNDQYKYLAYKTYPDNPTSDQMSYNIDNIATVDRINYTIKHQRSWAEIYCTVQLEDGRFAKSNVMHFTSEGWNNGSGGGESDEQAVANVENMIRVLP